jgi:hypothetical protein
MGWKMHTDNLIVQDSTEGDDLALLGAHQAAYESKPVNRALLWLFGGGSLLVVLIILGWSLQTTYYAYTQYGPAAAFFWGLPWLVVGAALFVLWLLFFTLNLSPVEQKVEVYKNGIVVRQRAFLSFRPRRHVILWDQISGIAVSSRSHKKPDRLTHRARLYLKPQKSIQFHDEHAGIVNLPELISRIKVNVYMRRLPAYRNSLHSGNLIDFGPISIDQKGISLHRWGKTLTFPWDQVHQVNALDGYLVVELEPFGGTKTAYRFSISQIPNIELLFQIIREDIEA